MGANTSNFTIQRYGPSRNDVPLVSILMLAYNHEKTIQQAITSVFSQYLDFECELIIGEDCSSDQTLNVIEAVCSHSTIPIPVKLLRSNVNSGMHVNFARTLQNCEGAFIAILEGDDYWTDPKKLSIQASFLINNTALSAVFHRAVIEYTTDKCTPFGAPGTEFPQTDRSIFSFGDVLRRDVAIQPLTWMFRRSSAPHRLPKWASDLPWVDSTLLLFLANTGSIGFIPLTMAAYRYGHGVSAKFAQSAVFYATIKMYKHFLPHVNRSNSMTLRKYAIEHISHEAYSLEKQGNHRKAASLLFWALRNSLVSAPDRMRIVSWLIRLALPSVHRYLKSMRNFLRSVFR